MRLLAAAFTVACGCATVPREPWFPTSAAVPSRDPFPDASTVTLYEKQTFRLTPDSTQKTVHGLMQLRSPAGLPKMMARVDAAPFDVLDLRARWIDPEGRVSELAPSQIRRVVDGTWLFLHFDGAKPGSVLEWTCTQRAPGYLTHRYFMPWGGAPILHFEVELILPTGVMASAFEGYNLRKGATLAAEQGFFYTRVRYAEDDVPAVVTEELAPHFTFDEPWWAFNAVELKGRNAEQKLTSWAFAMEAWIRDAFFATPEDPGLDANVPTGSCGEDRACLLDAILSWAREHLEVEELGAADSKHPRDRLAVLAARGKVTEFERALVLRRLLLAAGIQALPAATATAWSARVPEDFPTTFFWNRLLLYVPPQPGEGGDFWIDPSCPSCRAGELAADSLGTRALVLYADSAHPDGNASFFTVTGKPAPRDETLDEFRVAVDSDGAAEVAVSHSGRGGLALTLDALKEVCGDAKGECGFAAGMRLSRYARVSADELEVPLAMLTDASLEPFSAPRRERDVVIPVARTAEERVHVVVPAGWEYGGNLQDSTLRADGFELTLQIAREGGGVLVRRVLKEPAGRFPAQDWEAIRSVVWNHSALHATVLEFRRTKETDDAKGQAKSGRVE